MQRLPLFPLGTVLVPGLVMPLRVFEPRYLALMDELLGGHEDERVFGVVAIRSGHEVGEGNATALFDVGCTAVVRRVDQTDDGTLKLVTSGGVRFRLHDLDDTAGKPYPVGLVTPLPDTEGAGDVAGLAGRVGLRFTAYRESLGAAPVDLPSSPRVLSYLVAAGMALDLADRQGLLEQPDTARRLSAELDLLARERVLLDRLRAVPTTSAVQQASEN